MFKKLKDKIAEEVKSSPQRIQQLTQSVSEKIHTATSDDSFFSIGEDDAPSSNATPELGFSNVSLSNYSTPQSSRVRKNSNSSIASDMSFLPRYESSSNLYHLQSDLDVSASELEDNASTSSQLGHLTKEQIYAAFQKSQSRYHKYRGRYTDIANHYRELERENLKMKSVLVETQDKALRRVAELREQCSLEQKAKAHLENALRLELDEKQYIIDTLKTKVDLLQHKNDDNKPETLTTDDAYLNLETLTKDLKDAQTEIESLNERLQEHKANAIVFNSKESDLKNRVKELDEIIKQKANELADVLERERENNLIIAQTKMELHTEIQNRDLEIENLKQDVEALKSDLDQYESRNKSTKLENLQSQNTKLIEKIEELSVKCKGYESELLKLEQSKIENVNKIEEKVTEMRELEERHRKDIAEHRNSTKQHLLSLEAKIRETVEDEFRVKEERLRNDYESKLKQLAGNTNNFQEIQVKLLQKEDEVKSLSAELENVSEMLRALKDKHGELESGHLELISENGENLQKLKAAMKECELFVNVKDELERTLNEKNELKEQVKELQQHHATDNNELAKTKQAFQKKLKEQKTKFHDEIQTLTSEIISFKEKNTLIQTYIDEYKEKLNEYESASTEKSARLQETLVQNDNLMERLTKKDEEIVCLQRDAEERQKRLTEKEDRIVQLENEMLHENEELKMRLTEKEGQVKQLQKDLEENNSKMLRLENCGVENEEIHKRLSEKEYQLEQIGEKVFGLEKGEVELSTRLAEKEKQIGQLQNELQEIRSLNEKLSENESQATEKVFRLEKCETELSTCLAEKENQIGQLQNELQEICSLNEKLSEKESRTAEKVFSLEKCEAELSTRLTEKEKQIGQLQNELQEIRSLNEKLSEKESRTTQKVFSLEKCETELSTRLTEKEKQIGQLQNELQEIRSLNEKLSEKESQATEKVFRLEKCETELSTRLAKKEKQVGQLQNQLREFGEKMSASEKYESEYKEERVKLVEEIAQLITSNEDLQAQIVTTKATESELYNEKLESEQELIAMKSNFGEYKQMHASLKNKLVEEKDLLQEEVKQLQLRNNEMTIDYNHVTEENENLLREVAAINLKHEQLLAEKEQLTLENTKLQNNVGEVADNTELKTKLNTFENDNKTLQSQVRELEHQYSELLHERQLLHDEVQELKISPININNNENAKSLQDEHEKEINHLNEKIVQYKSLDLTNRSSIQFYENELQKLKNKNEKLNRKLDETLVTLNHCTELTSSTETEYLRNVLFNYMLGKESLVLARVIAAVCKFDDNQTEAILQREQQKQTLLGQLGFR